MAAPAETIRPGPFGVQIHGPNPGGKTIEVIHFIEIARASG